VPRSGECGQGDFLPPCPHPLFDPFYLRTPEGSRVDSRAELEAPDAAPGRAHRPLLGSWQRRRLATPTPRTAFDRIRPVNVYRTALSKSTWTELGAPDAAFLDASQRHLALRWTLSSRRRPRRCPGTSSRPAGTPEPRRHPTSRVRDCEPERIRFDSLSQHKGANHETRSLRYPARLTDRRAGRVLGGVAIHGASAIIFQDQVLGCSWVRWWSCRCLAGCSG
jgi:hypothetical protein